MGNLEQCRIRLLQSIEDVAEEDDQAAQHRMNCQVKRQEKPLCDASAVEHDYVIARGCRVRHKLDLSKQYDKHVVDD